MRNIRKLSILLALCLVLCALPVASAHAAESGSLWLRHLPTDGGVTMSLVADTTIASGVITLTYDPSRLTFQTLETDDAYVLAHAVNDKEAGQLQISWIGTGSGDGTYVLMRLRFAGDSLAVAQLSGSIQDADGKKVSLTTLDFGALNTAVQKASGLKAEDYTEASYAAVKAALDAALAQGEVETVTQAQLDGALQTLNQALENLEAYVPEPPPTEPPATEPTPTEPTPTEPAPTEPKPSEKPTQPGSQPKPTEPVVADPVPKKNDTLLIVGAVALCLVAAVAAVVILKKRGRK